MKAMDEFTCKNSLSFVIFSINTIYGNKKVKKEQVHTRESSICGSDWEKNTHEE